MTIKNDSAPSILGEASNKCVGYSELVRLLKGAACETWRASLCAGPQSIFDLFNELKDPKPGDLVMEITTCRM